MATQENQSPLVANLIEVFDPDGTLDFPSRNMDEVYPGLFVGNHRSATDLLRLQQEGITHVLNSALGKGGCQCDNDEDLYKETSIRFLGISMEDIDTFDMMPYFKQSNDFISAALNSVSTKSSDSCSLDEGGRVLVHCMVGASRSATLVIAHLMMERGMSVMEASKMVSKKREICPNPGFLSQLCKLQEDMDNKRKDNSK